MNETPSNDAPNPTPNSLAPLRATAPNRWAREKGAYPGGTFWKAFSGQVARKRSSALDDGAARAAYDRVGAGSHTSMKSATRAMATLAATKSSSEEKAGPRLVYSAVDFVNTPIPTSIATLTKKDGSASSRSRKPAMRMRGARKPEARAR